jgi:hypothetical protein
MQLPQCADQHRQLDLHGARKEVAPRQSKIASDEGDAAATSLCQIAAGHGDSSERQCMDDADPREQVCLMTAGRLTKVESSLAQEWIGVGHPRIHGLDSDELTDRSSRRRFGDRDGRRQAGARGSGPKPGRPNGDWGHGFGDCQRRSADRAADLSIGPGETQTVKIPLTPAPKGQATLDVEVKPVPGEQVSSNNKASYTVTFQ